MPAHPSRPLSSRSSHRSTRRGLLLALAGTQTLTLLVGSAAAVSLAPPAPSTPATSKASSAEEPRPPRPVVLPAHAVAKPVAPRRPALRPSAPRPQLVQPQESVVRRTAALLRGAKSPSLSPQVLMGRAVDRLPGYRPEEASFRLVPGLASWGLADLGNGTVWISSRVPASKMYSVVAHEWSHVVSVAAYDGDVKAALGAMNEHFEGSGIIGAERAADCMARELGATWTHYTPCSSASWRAGAHRLLARQPL